MMLRHLFLSVYLLLCSSLAYTQHLSALDSLYIQLSASKAENKARIYFLLSEAYFSQNPDSSLKYMRLAISDPSYSKLSIDSAFVLQKDFLAKLSHAGKQAQLIQYCDSLLINQNIDSLKTIQLITFKSVALSEIGQYELALTGLVNAATYYKREKVHDKLSNIYYQIGETLREQKTYEEALKYFNLSLEELAYGSPSEIAIGRIKNSAAIILYENEQIDSGIYLLKNILAVTDPVKDKHVRAVVYQNLGNAYMHQKMYDSSLYFLFKAQKIKESQGNKRGLLYTYNSISDVLLKENRSKEALQYLDKNQSLFKEIDDLHLERNTYKYLATAYANLSRWDSAYTYLHKSSKLTDSLNNNEKQQGKLRIIAGYENRLTEQENKILKTELLLEKERSSSQQLASGLILLVAIISLFALMIIYYFLRQKNSLFKKISEKNFKLRELNNEVNNLSGIIAHDLKSPLNKIEGLSNVLELEGGLTDSQLDILKRMRNVTQDGKNLIGDLIDISNYEQDNQPVKLQETKVFPILQEIIKQFNFRLKKKNIEIELLVPEYLMLNTHPTYYKRIIDNLVSNAIKFSPAGKTIEIGYQSEEDYKVIFIKDEGPGLSKEDKLQLFQKFKRLSAQPTGGENSTGLGLSIVRTLCDKLRAPIVVESEVGFGACFKIKFPN